MFMKLYPKSILEQCSLYTHETLEFEFRVIIKVFVVGKVEFKEKWDRFFESLSNHKGTEDKELQFFFFFLRFQFYLSLYFVLYISFNND